MIWELVYNNKLFATRHALEKGSNPNEVRFGFTLLMIASACDHKYMVKLLLENGSDKSIMIDGRSAYDCAWSEDSRNMLRL